MTSSAGSSTSTNSPPDRCRSARPSRWASAELGAATARHTQRTPSPQIPVRRHGPSMAAHSTRDATTSIGSNCRTLRVEKFGSINPVGNATAVPTTAAGYRQLLGWLENLGILGLVGVEGTGSYGAGLTRHRLAHDVAVVEVDRPNRQRRRRTGKSDPAGAVAAARAALGGDATGSAKTRDGNVEAMRVLRVACLSARTSRTQAINQMRSLISTAPRSGGPSYVTAPSIGCSPWPAPSATRVAATSRR